MYVNCNKCDKRTIFIDLFECAKCNKKYCKNCLIYDNCNKCLKKLNVNEKMGFCNQYKTNICIHCNEICIDNKCYCEGYIENRKIIDEIFQYLENKTFNDDIFHF